MPAQPADNRCDPAKKKSRRGDDKKANLPLKVLSSHTGAARAPSRVSRLRAGVLIAVNLAIAAHVVQWLIQGRTLSPVEPSEAMYTLETGKVNAGFAFLVLAIIATAIFGRFFCGWGCHIIAIQDLCTWLLEKIGIRPKPLRSRLLVWGPVALAFYMFVFPTLRRDVIHPLCERLGRESVSRIAEYAGFPSVRESIAGWRMQLPYWLGETFPLPGFKNAFITEDFWATFAPWYVAIPFLAVCGFATVYFLGNKGFCTYGCPYGGLFGPVDRISPGRIVVSDACEGCGHCTAVCTSNVRVHSEVRDFGMVVDPGCMKCLDCVSVCPNDALSWKITTPSAFAKPRTPEAKAGKVRRPDYDFSLAEEVLYAALGFALFFAWRGFLDATPMLMAVAIAGIGVYITWKAISLVRTPNVRMQNIQLRVKGSFKPAGILFLLCAGVFLACSVWSGLVRYARWHAEWLDTDVTAAQEVVFAPDYKPDPEQARTAARAAKLLDRSDRPNDLGLSWPLPPRLLQRGAWLHAVAGNLPAAEEHLTRAMKHGDSNEQLVQGFHAIVALQGKNTQQFREILEGIVSHNPKAWNVRTAIGYLSLQLGDEQRAAESFTQVLTARADEQAFRRAAEGLANMNRVADLTSAVDRALVDDPRKVEALEIRAAIAMVQGDAPMAEALLVRAAKARPRDANLWAQLAQVRTARGDAPGAAEAQAHADKLLTPR